ncbi:MAG: hypothetical protein IJ350_05890 [Clostridia bacterium]|nr:hypothetical protein [Clostridia bacterium]
MMQLVYALLAGLWLGLTLHWSSLTQPHELRNAIALRASTALRTTLSFLGWGAIMTAFLSWLAVLDVDLLVVSPLHGGVLIGGVIAGLGAALSGRTTLTALGGVGSASFLESLCSVGGCVLGALLLPLLGDMTRPLASLPPRLEGTLFRVTLDEIFLFQGGFLGQGCVGAVLLALALWISIPKPEENPVLEPEPITDAPIEEPLLIDEEPESPPDPDAAPEESLVVTLEGEEPLVLDTEAEEADMDVPDLPAIDDDEEPDIFEASEALQEPEEPESFEESAFPEEPESPNETEESDTPDDSDE